MDELIDDVVTALTRVNRNFTADELIATHAAVDERVTNAAFLDLFVSGHITADFADDDEPRWTAVESADPDAITDTPGSLPSEKATMAFERSPHEYSRLERGRATRWIERVSREKRLVDAFLSAEAHPVFGFHGAVVTFELRGFYQ